jgi:hypothetical protein
LCFFITAFRQAVNPPVLLSNRRCSGWGVSLECPLP